MRDIHSPEFQAAFSRDAVALDARGPVTLELGASVVIGLIATLQLALRHPGFKGPTANLMDTLARQLIDKVAVTATLRRGLEAGFNPQHDV